MASCLDYQTRGFYYWGGGALVTPCTGSPTGNPRRGFAVGTAHEQTPVTLGHMRALDVRSVYVTCSACGYASTVNVDDEPDDAMITSFSPHMRRPSEPLSDRIGLNCGNARVPTEGVMPPPAPRGDLEVRSANLSAAILASLNDNSMPNRLTNNQRRALEMLARAPHGLTEGAMFAYRFGADTLAGLALAGLVMIVTKTVRTGGPTTKAERFTITDAGQRTIAAPER